MRSKTRSWRRLKPASTMPETIAIIPARGGSKRIPRKNIRPMLGKPAIAWPLETLLGHQRIDRVIVSTDDPEIAATARAWGAETPFIRQAALSGDKTGLRPVIVDACERLCVPPETRVLCALPTAVLLDTHLINAVIDAKTLGGFAFLAVSYGHPPQRGFTRDANGRPTMLYPEHASTRTQDLPTLWHDAGTLYAATAATWEGTEPIFGHKSTAVTCPTHAVVDIDTLEDWETAQALLAWKAQNPCI